MNGNLRRRAELDCVKQRVAREWAAPVEREDVFTSPGDALQEFHCLSRQRNDERFGALIFAAFGRNREGRLLKIDLALLGLPELGASANRENSKSVAERRDSIGLYQVFRYTGKFFGRYGATVGLLPTALQYGRHRELRVKHASSEGGIAFAETARYGERKDDGKVVLYTIPGRDFPHRFQSLDYIFRRDPIGRHVAETRLDVAADGRPPEGLRFVTSPLTSGVLPRDR